MNWLKHTLINILLIALTFSFLKPSAKEVGIILAAGLLIDADHLLNHFSKKRIKGIRQAVRLFWDSGNNYMKEFHFLHSIEIVAALFILSFFYGRIFLLIGLAFLFHMTGDIILTRNHKKSWMVLDEFSLISFMASKKGNAF